ncbi:MAG: glycerol-3-phosphate 1-O-acyltransferase PlsY [Deltaproteobacteria bacterium]|nr:glycerol-3-phosphate 1-O-acyltransferase PlsY [Deltaproteobacteria bacterium]
MPLNTDLDLPIFLAYSVLFLLATFLLGSIPFGRIIGHWVSGIDVTQRGSGNIGATNVARIIGLKWGLLTLLLDGLKGFLPLFICALLFPQSEAIPALTGLSALLGHQYSIYLRFRGGKGFATALGVYLALSPPACLISLLVFVITVYGWRYVSVGSMVSSCFVPLMLLVLGESSGEIAVTLIMAVLICVNHRDNLYRLAQGQERKWGEKTLRREDPEDVPAPHGNKTR